ncbi:glutathione S-transferase family protein [Parvibaculum sp.]|uniref:glutathione S-transferase family protein n=1 Tax=Parvibaculum sp. TaxID=2024848 RepID=UPI00391B2884
MPAADRMTVHGLTLSYFTGKLEAYLRAKGIPYRFAEMDTASFRRAGRATGVLQMPQIEMPDGRWLTDTTAIIARFEAEAEGPSMSPSDPATKFVSLLLEDYGDEWLWRPALHYRWSFPEDMTLMSSQIARTMMRDLKLPFWMKRQAILRRQRKVYLAEDGVTSETAPQIEALYLDTLDAMETVLAKRPFLMGERPVEADFGFFGSMFRHFSSDPTPAGIMRARAPHVALWVARLWAVSPREVAAARLPAEAPEDLAPIYAHIVSGYLPYLAANDRALAAGETYVSYEVQGIRWKVPVNPYRAHCLAVLCGHYENLDLVAREKVDCLLPGAAEVLSARCRSNVSEVTPSGDGRMVSRPLDRQWRGQNRQA